MSPTRPTLLPRGMEIVRERALGSLERMSHHNAICEGRNKAKLGEGEHRNHGSETDHLEDSLWMRRLTERIHREKGEWALWIP